MRKPFTLLVLFLGLMLPANSQTIVEAHGQLHVDGTKIKDACGREVQLKGMSFFWHQWENSTDYWNEETLKWLIDDWNVQMVRIPIGSINGTGYVADKETAMNATRRLLDAASKLGVYVIVDWHVHDIYLKEATEFFTEVARDYGHLPNIIYEIFNEPDYETWPEVKAYSESIIATIRKYDPDNIIGVGSPKWNQDIKVAVDDPIIHDAAGNSVSNIAYMMHFYADQHRQSIRDVTKYALDKGFCVIIAECGRTGVNWGPDNTINDEEWNKWMQFADEHKLSWTKWSLSKRNEICGSLTTAAGTKGNWNLEKDLTSEGRLMRDYLRTHNKIPKPCSEL